LSYAALAAELAAGHPDTGPYDADNAIAAGELNAKNRSKNRTSMSGSEILNAIDKTEFNALTAANKQLVWDLLHLGTLNPFGIEAGLFVDAFGGGSTTITSLAALRKESISRGEELGLGIVTEGDVEIARA